MCKKCRFLSVILAVILCVGLFSTYVFADTAPQFLISAKKLTDDNLTISLIAEDCIGLQSFDLKITYDEETIVYKRAYQGDDAKQVTCGKNGLLNTNSFDYERNPYNPPVILFSAYFREELWDSERFAADAKEPGTVQINSDAFECINFVFTIKDHDAVSTDIQVEVIRVRGVAAQGGIYTIPLKDPNAPTVCEHVWNEGAETLSPTCTVAGIRTFTCTLCSDTYTEEIPATGHHFGEWETVRVATANQKGQETRTCEKCGCTEDREIDYQGQPEEEDRPSSSPNPTIFSIWKLLLELFARLFSGLNSIC